MATTNTKLKDFLAETGFVSKVGWSRNPIPLFGPCLAAYTMWICGQNVSMEFDRRNPRLGPCAMDHGWKPDLLYRKRCMKRLTFILRRLFAIPCLGFATVMPEAMPALASEPEGGIGVCALAIRPLLLEFVNWAEQVHECGPVGSDFETVLQPVLARQISTALEKAMVEPVTLFIGTIPPKTVLGTMIFHGVGFGPESVFSGDLINNETRYDTALRFLSHTAEAKLNFAQGARPLFRSNTRKWDTSLSLT